MYLYLYRLFETSLFIKKPQIVNSSGSAAQTRAYHMLRGSARRRLSLLVCHRWPLVD